VGTRIITVADLTPFSRLANPAIADPIERIERIVREVIHFGVYGSIGRGSSAESESPLERRGIQLTEQGHYAEARSFFERVLPMRAEPLCRAQVLQNIMLTYIKEGNRARAMETGQDILEVFGLTETPEGTELHGEIVGRFNRDQF
jgi:hypothetical protein